MAEVMPRLNDKEAGQLLDILQLFQKENPVLGLIVVGMVHDLKAQGVVQNG